MRQVCRISIVSVESLIFLMGDRDLYSGSRREVTPLLRNGKMRTSRIGRMKIRKKAPKPAQSGAPLYVVGYSGPPPSAQELQSWFDVEYGGPLKCEAGLPHGGEQPAAPYRIVHGPWQAQCRIICPPAEARHWQTALEWRHDQAATVAPMTAGPRDACDQVLLAARVARGLVLLTDGTSFDLRTHAFLNPSDWTDRRLERFMVSDHVLVRHDDTADGGRDWFFTQGLAKFGLEEIEVFRPRGLPAQPEIEQLSDIANELVRLGQVPKVAGAVSLPLLGLSVRAVRHRTATYAGASLILREVAWDSAG